MAKKPARAARRARAAKPVRKAPRQRTNTRAKRAPKRAVRRAAVRAAQPAPPAGRAGELAARMTAFSEKVLDEEAEPVAVRSWGEAKKDQPGARELLPKTGKVRPVEEDGEPDEEAARPVARPPPAEPEEDLPATRRPTLNPLTGPLAVPKDVELEFKVEKAGKKRKGKKGERPEEFGLVELRQATATGGRHLTRSKRENLQKGASRIHPLASPEKEEPPKRRAAPERFEVAPDRRQGPRLPDLSDFGEVEVGQQTLSGSRKVGRLDLRDEDEAPAKRRKGSR